jgi:hypothetical protein
MGVRTIVCEVSLENKSDGDLIVLGPAYREMGGKTIPDSELPSILVRAGFETFHPGKLKAVRDCFYFIAFIDAAREVLAKEGVLIRFGYTLEKLYEDYTIRIDELREAKEASGVK